jgi:hypothetical protein
MKVFVTQLIPLVFKKIFLTELLLFVLLFSMSLQAETRYLFPSDIIDQAEQAIYNANRTDRYIAQRKWVYPKDIRTDGWPVDKIPTPINTNVQYDGQRYPNLLYVSDIEPDNHSNRWKNKAIQYSFQNQGRQGYPNLRYASDIEPDNRSTRRKNKAIQYSFQNQGRQGYPNLRYVSDIEPVNRSARLKSKAMQYSLQKTKEQSRSIPAPLFPPYQRNAPRMLPGIFPGIIVPPGYSHFGPNYNYGGLNNMFYNQYNPFTRYGVFPKQWNSPGN